MAKKKTTISEPIHGDDSPPSGEAFVKRATPEEISPTTGTGKRLVLKFDEGGGILWDRMTDEQKAAFGASVANDPTALELIGLAASNGEAIEEGTIGEGGHLSLPIEIPQIEEEDVKEIFLALSWVSKFSLKFGMKRFAGMDIKPEILKQSFQYTPEQLERLGRKGTKVANKYAPEWFKKYYDEITLITLFGHCISEQCKNAITAQMIANFQEAQSRPKVAGGDHSANKTDVIPMIQKEDKIA